MLRLIEGGFSSDAYEKIKTEIKKLISLEKRVFLLVPEQQAVTAEKEILKELPPSATLSFEVTNFTRLSNTVARELGGLSREYSDTARESLIMWRALTELSPFLAMTNGAREINSGLVEKAMAAVKEMKSISARPDAILEICENERLNSQKRLRDKLSDIAKIMTLYEKLLSEKYTSASDDVERLAEKLSQNPDCFNGASFFVSGFTSFTEPQYKALAALMRTADVTVHLVLSKHTESFFEFSEILATKENLVQRANKANVKTELVRCGQRGSDAPLLLSEVADLLWRNYGNVDNDSLQNIDDTIRIFEAGDVYSECEFVASDIKRQVMENGAEFSDFAIVARDANRYLGIIDSYLDGADIPYFISKRTDISSYEAVKLIYAAFEAVTGGFMREDVIAYAKCRLSGIAADECDEFELYCEKWQINGKRFTDGLLWNMSPDGYESRKSKDHDERLLLVNATRDKLITPLVKLWDNISSAICVIDYANALVAFLSDISLEENLYKRCERLRSLGETAIADDNEKLWKIICAALDALVEVLGDCKIDASGFLSQLKVVLSSADIGKIPAFADEVTVGSADMIRLSGKKQVYLIGVNEGVFPMLKKASGYFTERDKITLAELGLNTAPENEISTAREFFFFSRAFSSARVAVTLSYSKRDEALVASEPSSVINRICNILGGKIQPIKISEIPVGDRIYFPLTALDFIERAPVKEALIASGYEATVKVAESPISNLDIRLSQKALDSLYSEDISLSQSRIDDFISCPFAYYLRYNIKLSSNEVAKFDARNIGTFIHAMLESFFGEVRKSGEVISDITKERRAELVSLSAKKYLSQVVDESSKTKRTEILLKRLEQYAMPVVDGLCEELSGCSFVPEFFELKIGGDEEYSPRPATFVGKDGKGAKIYGSVDRVDTYKHGDDVYVRVIDYKTGSKSFSPSDIDEGKNLQMFLYLKAITEDTGNDSLKKKLGVGEGGRVVPAGVIYIQTDMSDVRIDHNTPEDSEKARKETQKRKGMLLDNEVSLAAMNKSFIPVKYKKDGTPDARSQKLLYSENGWQEINQKISDKVLEVADAMRGGDISPTKKSLKETHCDVCKFKVVCRRRLS